MKSPSTDKQPKMTNTMAWKHQGPYKTLPLPTKHFLPTNATTVPLSLSAALRRSHGAQLNSAARPDAEATHNMLIFVNEYVTQSCAAERRRPRTCQSSSTQTSCDGTRLHDRRPPLALQNEQKLEPVAECLLLSHSTQISCPSSLPEFWLSSSFFGNGRGKVE